MRREFYSATVRPVDALSFITYRCTSRCATCNIWQRSKMDGNVQNKELSLEQWGRVPLKLKDAGIESLEIFGGDALLRKDVVHQVLEECKQQHIETYMPTNCNLLDRQTADMLVKSGLGTIYFSIDGLDEIQNKIRGRSGTYERTTDAINNIVRAKEALHSECPKMIFLPTISNLNFHQIEALLDEFETYPIDAVYLRALGEMTPQDAASSTVMGVKATPYFVTTTEETHLFSVEQYKKLREKLNRCQKGKHSRPYYLSTKHIWHLPEKTFTRGVFPKHKCHVCTTLVTLAPNGDVSPCPFFTDYVLGNIEEEKLLDIWNNIKHKRFLKKQRRGELAICRKCSMRFFYPGTIEFLHQTFAPKLFELLSRPD